MPFASGHLSCVLSTGITDVQLLLMVYGASPIVAIRHGTVTSNERQVQRSHVPMTAANAKYICYLSRLEYGTH